MVGAFKYFVFRCLSLLVMFTLCRYADDEKHILGVKPIYYSRVLGSELFMFMGLSDAFGA